MPLIDLLLRNPAHKDVARLLYKTSKAGGGWSDPASLSTFLSRSCEAEPQAYLRELRESLREKGVSTSTSGLHRFFARHKISRKKGICTPPSKVVPT